jgi:hypothetical protein
MPWGEYLYFGRLKSKDQPQAILDFLNLP